jgi:proline iminopeptidase
MIYGLVGFITICAAIVAGGLIWRTSLQNETRLARAKIDATTGVDELFKTEIGGIQQWIHARGVHRSDPVLLYLHGGPGTPMMPFEGLFQNPLEHHFIVVHWDQRGVAKTYRENPSLDYPATMTYERMIKDASEMVDLLRNRYAKEKVIVLGHSWGSMLGLGLLNMRSDGIAAYVGTGQLVDTLYGQKTESPQSGAGARVNRSVPSQLWDDTGPNGRCFSEMATIFWFWYFTSLQKQREQHHADPSAQVS